MNLIYLSSQIYFEKMGYQFPSLLYIEETDQILYLYPNETSPYCLKFFDAKNPTKATDTFEIPREDYKSLIAS